MPRGPKGERRPANAMGQYVSKPLPVFTKLAAMLRNVPAVQFVFAKFAALLRSNKGSGEPVISEFLDDTRGVTRNSVDQPVAILESPVSYAITAPQSNDLYEREKLIRRRWTETGIKMWNRHVHGAGLAALNIQGRTELLPVKPGETLPGYPTRDISRFPNGSCRVRACVEVASVSTVKRVLDDP
jgi:hypothetical protein